MISRKICQTEKFSNFCTVFRCYLFVMMIFRVVEFNLMLTLCNRKKRHIFRSSSINFLISCRGQDFSYLHLSAKVLVPISTSFTIIGVWILLHLSVHATKVGIASTRNLRFKIPAFLIAAILYPLEHLAHLGKVPNSSWNRNVIS